MKYPDATELYKRIEAGRKLAAKRPIAEKLAVTTKLRDAQEKLAPMRAANKAKRKMGPVVIRKVKLERP